MLIIKVKVIGLRLIPFCDKCVFLIGLGTILLMGSCDREPLVEPYYMGQKPPGLIAERFAENILFSTITETVHDELHSSVYFSPSGKEMYYTIQSRSVNTGIYKQKIMMIKLENGEWSKPEVAPFSGKFSDSFSSFSLDGKLIYFESDRPIDAQAGNINGNMWYVEYLNDEWSQAAYIGSPLADNSKVQNPSFAENGTLYFKRSYPKGDGWGEILSAKYFQTKYENPVKLGPEINSGFYENFPTIASDESYLIFYRMIPGGQTGQFISFKTNEERWTPGKFLGQEINGGGTAFSVSFSPDGKYLFYLLRADNQLAKNELMRNEGIYWVATQVVFELEN